MQLTGTGAPLPGILWPICGPPAGTQLLGSPLLGSGLRARGEVRAHRVHRDLPSALPPDVLSPVGAGYELSGAGAVRATSAGGRSR